MISGEWCPDELIAAGSKNSMLGEITGRDLPLTFTNSSGTLVVTGQANSANVLAKTIGCHSVALVTDAVLSPPAGVTVREPVIFPLVPTRHITCNPVQYLPLDSSSTITATTPAPSSAPSSSDDASSGESGNRKTGLAIGLGVGGTCAVILAAGILFVAYRRHKAQPNGIASNKLSFSAGSASPEVLTKLSDDDREYDPNGLTNGSWASVPALSLFTGDVAWEHNTARIWLAIPFVITPEGTKISAVDPGKNISETSPSQHSSFKSKHSLQLSRLGSSDGGSLDLWEIKPEDVTIVVNSQGKPTELGRGSFGAVYRGVLRGVQPAAIKVLNASVGSEAEAAFQREAAILKHVNRDRNIVQLYGTSRMPDGKLLLLTELMHGGDLRKALDTPATAALLEWQNSGKRVALDIARGLIALHAVNVVHRDLKSKNVLLASNLEAKIGDVGIAAVHSGGYLTASAGQVLGTLAWSAPELLLALRCTDKVDIWSIGVVLWEIATGRVPQRVLMETPAPSERCPAELIKFISDCTDPDAINRPTAREVYDRLLAIPPIIDDLV